MQLGLSELELEFYSKQLLVTGWGLKEQLALKESTIIINFKNDLLVLYLAGSGVGRIIYKNSVDKIEELNPNITVSKTIDYVDNIDNCFEIVKNNEKSIYKKINLEQNTSEVKSALLTATKCVNTIAKI